MKSDTVELRKIREGFGKSPGRDIFCWTNPRNKTTTLHKTLLVAAAVMALATPAMAEGPSQTGNGWVDYCHSSVGSWKWVACSWYARGLADTFILWQRVSPETALVCIDPKSQGQPLVDVGLDYIKANPKTRADYAGNLLASAFKEAWPCAEEKTS